MSRAHSRARAVVAIVATVTLDIAAAGCRQPLPAPPPPRVAPIRISLEYLRHLRLDLTVRGRRVRAVALYATAPDYHLTPSPARDGFEGVACVDDAARAAVAYLRQYEFSRVPADRADALGLLAFVATMEQGDGEFVNFVDSAGRPNLHAPSSIKSLSYWGARAIWAFGEAARVLGPAALDSAGLRAPFDRALVRLAHDIDAHRLIAGSATATSEALLGVLALQRAEPTAAHASLAGRMADLLVPLQAGDEHTAPWGARLDSTHAEWHAWGARTVEALATAGAELGRADLVAAAKREADQAWTRFLVAGRTPSEILPGGQVVWYGEIAYGVSPMVGGWLALADATGDRRYAKLAGLAAAWLLGANVAGVPMYDERVGRTFDGIDSIPGAGVKVNRNAGAESTVEGLLAIEAVNRDPDAAEYAHFHAVGPSAASLADVPAAREFAGPGGARVAVRRNAAGTPAVEIRAGSAPVTLTYWPAANPTEVDVANRLVAEWNRDHPDVRVRVQPLPAGRSSEEVLLAAIVGHATPDVCSNVSSALLARLVRAGGVVRLDDREATAARLYERTTAPMLAPLRLPDGGVYAFPWKTNPELLMYNVDALRAAGVRPPRTQSELLEAFRRLARDADGDGRRDHWAMWASLKTTWFERFYDFYPLYLASSGGRTIVSHDSAVFDNPAAVSALELLRRGFAEGLLPKANFAIGRDPFADGTVAMKIIGPWFIPELERIRTPGLRYDVVPVPAADGVPPDDQYAFGDLRNIAVFSTTRHPDAAARFVAWLTSPEADRVLIEMASQLPYRRDVAVDPRFGRALARWPTLPTYARYVGHTRDLDIDPDVVEIFDVLSEAYEAGAVYGTVPVPQALASAAREATRILHAR